MSGAENHYVYDAHKVWKQLKHGARPRDLVDRQFVPTRRHQRWVSDFTYVAKCGGFVVVAAPGLVNRLLARSTSTSSVGDDLRPRDLVV
ncbi:MAG: hypothetical protein ABIZ91_04050 [Gemmatimonadaceae bacterium]